MTTKQRQEIVALAVALLEAGTLASAIPGRLMEEFGLARNEARDLTVAALQARNRQRKGRTGK
jgi:hypothetical protein